MRLKRRQDPPRPPVALYFADAIAVLELGVETIDDDTAAALLTSFADVIAAGSRDVVLDLTALTFLELDGMGYLIGMHHRLRPNGRLAAVAKDKNVVRTFHRTGLHAIIPLYPDLSAAVGARGDR